MFEFIETPFFTKALEHYLDDDEYARLQHYLNIPAHLLKQMKEAIDDA